MTSHQLLDLKGNSLGDIALEDKVFGIEPNRGVLHSALIRQLANARAGTASTKTRSEVSGGGKKPWRQKGTGRARAGSIRSPLWEGGGVIFGPKPRSHALSMPKKMRTLAIKSALAARKDNLLIVRDFDALKNAKTKEMAQVLKNLKIYGQKILVVLDFASDQCAKVNLALRNIDGVKVIHVNNLNVKDLIDCNSVLTTERAIELINNRFKSSHKDPTRTASGETRAKARAHAKAESAVPKAPKVKEAQTAVKKLKETEGASDKTQVVKLKDKEDTKVSSQPEAKASTKDVKATEDVEKPKAASKETKGQESGGSSKEKPKKEAQSKTDKKKSQAKPKSHR
jgi:large subunit ribosomal protein L4